MATNEPEPPAPATDFFLEFVRLHLPADVEQQVVNQAHKLGPERTFALGQSIKNLLGPEFKAEHAAAIVDYELAKGHGNGPASPAPAPAPEPAPAPAAPPAAEPKPEPPPPGSLVAIAAEYRAKFGTGGLRSVAPGQIVELPSMAAQPEPSGLRQIPTEWQGFGLRAVDRSQAPVVASYPQASAPPAQGDATSVSNIYQARLQRAGLADGGRSPKGITP